MYSDTDLDDAVSLGWEHLQEHLQNVPLTTRLLLVTLGQGRKGSRHSLEEERCCLCSSVR